MEEDAGMLRLDLLIAVSHLGIYFYEQDARDWILKGGRINGRD